MSQNLSLPDLIQQGQLPPHSEEKNVVSQIKRYNRWPVDSGRRLYQPDLEAYRDHLLGSLKPSSVQVHLSNIWLTPAQGASLMMQPHVQHAQICVRIYNRKTTIKLEDVMPSPLTSQPGSAT